MSELQQQYGTGRRKPATARVFLRPGTGEIQINGRAIDSYFPSDILRMVVRQPLVLTETAERFDNAYVADDPNTLFKVVGVTASLVVSTTGGFVYEDIGTNVKLVPNTLNTTTNDSQQAVRTGSVAKTRSLPMRIVDVVEDTAFVSSGTTYYPEVIVKFNSPYITSNSLIVGGHAYNNPLGI